MEHGPLTQRKRIDLMPATVLRYELLRRLWQGQFAESILDSDLPSRNRTEEYLVGGILEGLPGLPRECGVIRDDPEKRAGVEQEPQSSAPSNRRTSASGSGSKKPEGTWKLSLPRPMGRGACGLACSGRISAMGTLRRQSRNVRLHHLEDEEAVALNEGVLVEPALEACVALADERCADGGCRLRGKAELPELVELGAGGVADADDRVGESRRGEVDHALAALAHQLEAVAARRDHETDEGGGELEDGVPAERHDVGAAQPPAGDQDDGAGLEVAPDPGDGEVVFLWMRHDRPRAFG